jgi:hypothetical protein
MNPANGIRVAGYTARTRSEDHELRDLAAYLLLLKGQPSTRALDHERWRDMARTGGRPLYARQPRSCNRHAAASDPATRRPPLLVTSAHRQIP